MAKGYKLKSKRALMKRVKVKPNGQLVRKSAYTGHLAPRKSTKQKRHLRKTRVISPTDYKRIRSLLSI